LPGNNPPVISPVGNKSVNEGQALSFTISATDSDGDVLSYTTNNLPSGASFNENTKTFVWTPTYNQAGTYSNIIFQVSDGKDPVSDSITITVGNINRPPVFDPDPIPDIFVSEGATVTLSPTATDLDEDPLTFSYTGWMTSSSYTTNYTDAGPHTVTVTVSDGTSTASQVVTITVVEKDKDILEISNLASGETYEIVENGLQNGVMVYSDRDYTYSTVPNWLQGTTYIKTANDDKNSSAASFLTFDVNQDVTVYVAYDSRVTTTPSWLESFTDAGDDLVNTDTTLNLFARNSSAGAITLGGSESGISMYTVIIVGQGNVVDIIQPSTPANLQATAISTSQINLSWNTSSDNIGVTGYKIYRDGIQVADVSNTAYQDTGLSSSTTYSYTVSAYDAAGNESSQSTPVSTADNIPPEIPTGLKIVGT